MLNIQIHISPTQMSLKNFFFTPRSFMIFYKYVFYLIYPNHFKFYGNILVCFSFTFPAVLDLMYSFPQTGRHTRLENVQFNPQMRGGKQGGDGLMPFLMVLVQTSTEQSQNLNLVCQLPIPRRQPQVNFFLVVLCRYL